MSEELPPLDPRMLEPLREEEKAPPAVRARARERLLTAVGSLAGGTSDKPSSPPSSSPGSLGHVRRAGALGTPAVAALAFAVGAAVGAGLWANLRPVPARIVYVDRVVPGPSPIPGPSLEPAALPGVTAASPPPLPAAPTSVANAAAATAMAPRDGASQLGAERILLDEARAALAQGEPDRALDRLERHRRSFPTPLLGEERDAMWIQALVKAGRYAEARARAASFRRRWPDSLFTSVVDSAIDSIP